VNTPLQLARSLVMEPLKVWLTLLRIMVPIIIIVKVLKELDLIRYAALPLAPFMKLVGLPGDMGLVWATALVNNLYSAIVVYAALARDAAPLTAAQVTVLATMMLVAHNMPLELSIARRCGVSFWAQTAVRMGGALLSGACLSVLFTSLNVLQEPAVLLWTARPETGGLLDWALGQARNLGWIYCIIFSLMTLMRLLNLLRITDLFTFLLKPVLRLMGIGPKAATITIIGLTMGIAYGGGLMIHEARSGVMTARDLFSAISLMGLTHALVEDTLLMLLMGAHLAGIFWWRLVFSLLAVALLGRLYVAVRGAEAAAAPAG
jgi:hypothetical protein